MGNGSKPGRESTARARELGGELREARERTRLHASDMARVLGWSASKVSRLESGTRGTSEVDVAIYLASCGVDRGELERLLDLAREVDGGYWLRPHGRQLPDELRSLIFQENIARTITSYEPLLIPGLLQTEGYARGLFRWLGQHPDRVEMKVQARLDRQSLLRRQRPPGFTCYVHEQALRSTVGDASVMHEQLLYLTIVTASARCELRVVPASAGPHGALGGAFRLMRFAEHPPVAYVENQTASLFLEEPADIAAYEALLTKVDAVSLDGGQSRRLLAHLASEYEHAEDGASP